MKDYKEMARSVLLRRDRYMERRRRRIKRAASTLSVCGVLAGAGAFAALFHPYAEEIPPKPPQEILSVTENEDVDMGADIKKEKQEFATGIDGDPSGYWIPERQTVGEIAEQDKEENCTEVCIDLPVAESPGSAGALNRYEEIWGGSYTDERGNTVIFLTENTQENREKVFQINPSLTEENTIFKDADYTLSYLTELMANISMEMGADGKIPFVATAALREERNRVEVTLTSEDKKSLEMILAFDKLGGAIEVLYAKDFEGKA